MHLMIPYASAVSDEARHCLRELALPNLCALLGRLTPAPELLGEDEYSPHTPQELALARLRGLPAGTSLPTAAWLREQTKARDAQAWALLTPLHLSVGTDQVTALGPRLLALDEAESRAFFAALAPLFPSDEGWACEFLAPDQWLIAHPSLDALPCASLERVLDRSVSHWMPEARALRLLQNEIQLMLHGLPLNEAREARGALPLNSVWISGCGVGRGQVLPAELQQEFGLREPLLTADWSAWMEAWRALDAGPLAALLRASATQPLRLTLCGERHARSWAGTPARGWRKLRQALLPPNADAALTLEAL
ncbi:hypothetical protein [Paucibacter soli]|uniref:hypothetical protein n=1 Tax=Paucibacter soli TaxID=3133433 RepID=UPI0030992E68